MFSHAAGGFGAGGAGVEGSAGGGASWGAAAAGPCRRRARASSATAPDPDRAARSMDPSAGMLRERGRPGPAYDRGSMTDPRAGRAAVVLCGGESSRMGRPKALLPFGPEAL